MTFASFRKSLQNHRDRNTYRIAAQLSSSSRTVQDKPLEVSLHNAYASSRPLTIQLLSTRNVSQSTSTRLTVEALLIRNIIHQKYTHSTSIIRRCNRPESLLASGIPYLQLNSLSVQFNGANLEVDANSRDERRSERVLGETQETAGLAYAGVANE